MIEHRYSILAQRVGELSNVRGDAPSFVTGDQLGRTVASGVPSTGCWR
jgi:hypothetical protein